MTQIITATGILLNAILAHNTVIDQPAKLPKQRLGY